MIPRALFLSFVLAFPTLAGELRLGIIGLDTSHATAFTEILHNRDAKDFVPGARVVAAYKGGSADIESSASRVEGYTQTLREKHGVRIYDSIAEMCRDVDAVLLESVDGRPHLEQARPVIAARKPLFIDKPMTASLRDANEIFRLAREAGVPVFSSSSLRFGKATVAARAGAIGTITNALASSPSPIDKTHPDLFWYGIHGVESLFTVMGTGCQRVRRTNTVDGRIEVIGEWAGNRSGTFREDKTYTGVARGTGGQMAIGAYDGYAPLVVEIIRFFCNRQPPVAAAETLELFAFMEAADESKRRGGEWVTIAETMRRAGVALPGK